MNPIHLYWYRCEGGRKNFGDDLSPLIVEYVAGRRVKYARFARCDMLAAGSIIDNAIAKRWKRLASRPITSAIVWGSGSFGNRHRGFRPLEFRAVRGPMTRDLLGLSDNVPLGDPGLLLGRLMQNSSRRYRWGLVPHMAHTQTALVRQYSTLPGIKRIDIQNPDVMQAAYDIASCDFVLSSSLHGLIAADSLGIPSVWLYPEQDMGVWKFHDYFSSVARQARPVSQFVDLAALEQSADCASAKLVQGICDGLEKVFPYR